MDVLTCKSSVSLLYRLTKKANFDVDFPLLTSPKLELVGDEDLWIALVGRHKRKAYSLRLGFLSFQRSTSMKILGLLDPSPVVLRS